MMLVWILISAKKGARKTRIHYTCMIEIRWFDLVFSPDDLTLFRKGWTNHLFSKPSVVVGENFNALKGMRRGQFNFEWRISDRRDSQVHLCRRGVSIIDLCCAKYCRYHIQNMAFVYNPVCAKYDIRITPNFEKRKEHQIPSAIYTIKQSRNNGSIR